MEIEILSQAIEKFRAQTGIELSVIKAGKTRMPVDGFLEARLPNRNIRLMIPYEVKAAVYKHHLDQILNLQNDFPDLLIVSRKITGPVREILKKNQINYLQTNGNCLIDHPDYYVYINGSEPESMPKEWKLTPVTAILVFAYLAKPEILQATYRAIAALTDTGLDRISATNKQLRQKGFLVSSQKNKFVLIHKKDLFKRWITAYDDVLRRKLLLGVYRSLDKNYVNDWRKYPIDTSKTIWGGENGAAILTEYLRPAKHTLYTINRDIITKLRLVPDNEGNIQLFNLRNDLFRADENRAIVHPFLIYAELIASGDSRNIEVASMVYEQAIAGTIDND